MLKLIGLVPPWALILIVLAVIGSAFGSGFQVATWRSSGEIAESTARADTATKTANEATAFRMGCIEDLKLVAKNLTEMDTFARGRDALYREAIARQPEVITEYEDRWHEAREAIVSEECPSAVGELFEWIHTLPAYAAGGAP